MSTTRTPDQVKAEYIRVMGDQLGPLYAALWQEVAGLHMKWAEFVTLFGTKPSRIELLNKVAPEFFSIVQNALWENVLLHITRLTDPQKSGRKQNLSILSMNELIDHPETKATAGDLANKALAATTFCRDWRNRRIAHRDLDLALANGAVPLELASREKVRDGLKALAAVLNTVESHYAGSTTYFEFKSDSALSLLYVLDDGLTADKARWERRKSGNFVTSELRQRDL